jgi:hypothetical protein
MLGNGDFIAFFFVGGLYTLADQRHRTYMRLGTIIFRGTLTD